MRYVKQATVGTRHKAEAAVARSMIEPKDIEFSLMEAGGRSPVMRPAPHLQRPANHARCR